MPEHFVGIDVGTSGTKALLIDGRGRVAGSATVPHENLFPRPGWSEERPKDWWKSTCTAVRRALRGSRRTAADIGGVGLSGQMHGSVFLDARQRVLRNAILWNDQRTGAECEEIERRAGGRAGLIRLVSNPALTGYTAPKVLWLRNSEPELFRRLRTVLLPKDYIRLRLTGVAGMDVSDASGTLLFDIGRRRWSTELMGRLDLDPALFPAAVESAVVVGQVTRAAARETGLKAGTPVVAGAGDQAASAVGTGVVREGVVSATIGTSGVVFAHSPSPVPNDEGLLQSFCHAVPGAWCVFGCMLSAGGSLQWARRVLMADRLERARSERQKDAIYEAMLREAFGGFERGRAGPSRGRHIKDGRDDGDLLFLPYLTGERCPYPHPHARGAWVGLTSRHTRADLIRAVVEGVTLGMGSQLEIMRRVGVVVREIRLAGGGARNSAWRQLQADVYGAPCVSMRTEEGSAMGAALLAAVGAGRLKSVETACDAAVQARGRYEPRAERTRHYESMGERTAEAYRALEPGFRRYSEGAAKTSG